MTTTTGTSLSQTIQIGDISVIKIGTRYEMRNFVSVVGVTCEFLTPGSRKICVFFTRRRKLPVDTHYYNDLTPLIPFSFWVRKHQIITKQIFLRGFITTLFILFTVNLKTLNTLFLNKIGTRIWKKQPPN